MVKSHSELAAVPGLDLESFDRRVGLSLAAMLLRGGSKCQVCGVWAGLHELGGLTTAKGCSDHRGLVASLWRAQGELEPTWGQWEK